MNIDQNDGTIVLPNGFSIPPSLSQNAFRQMPVFDTARAQSFGTPPWIHYHFVAGRIVDREVVVSLCFYDQILVFVSLTANVPDCAPDATWADYSLDIEAATKDCHDRMLELMLGAPSRNSCLSIGHLSPGQMTLAHSLVWQFRWGEVTSGHDFKGGGTSITVKYGDRHEQACKAYISRR